MGCFVCYQLWWIRWIGRVFLAVHIRPGQKWWWTLLGREISCSQSEGPSMHSRCLAFLPFKFWVGVVGKEFFFILFFHFPLVPNVFTWSSQLVLIRFPICSPSFQCVPQHGLHSSSLLSHMLWQMLSSFHRWAKQEKHYTSKQNIPFWGASIVSIFFSDGPIKLACCPKKEIELGRQLI